ncbi:AMP-binding protein [Rhodophyticola sp. MJ-SS7]|nr:AMP-binding protein [Rhodophyticola sp. MJ-SS7]MDU8944846.1 AMP-binding protein [Rhodophyticola sp. MJ-SS7]
MAAACCDVWARAEPQRPAIHHITSGGTTETWTYGDLKRASDRLANALRSRGVERGDRVAILLPQCPEVMITHFAAMKLGAIALPLFTLFGEEALAFRLSDSGARVCVTDPDNSAKLATLDCPELSHILVTGAGTSGLPSFEDEIKAASEAHTPILSQADDPAILIYTSGTTGAPKGALHAHRFLIGHLPSVELQHEFLPQAGDMGWTPADWAWIGGLMDLAMPCLYHGVPLISHRMRKFDPDEAFALIRDHRVRNMFLPPTALKLMRRANVPKGVDIRSIGSGGESLGADLHDWGKNVLGAPINEIYGQTECNLVISTCHQAMDIRPGTMGRAVPGHEVAILDAAGKPVPDGETGEICVRAPDPVMFLGYWNRPDATAEKVKDGWLRTGDLGTCDSEGYFTFVSRDDDVITSAGYRIGPTEIENCLTGDEDVVNAAVVGLPDLVRTEAVTAFVVLREGADRDGAMKARLIARVRDRVSPHAAPRRVEIVESLPTTATGKVMRRALRDEWRDR